MAVLLVLSDFDVEVFLERAIEQQRFVKKSDGTPDMVSHHALLLLVVLLPAVSCVTGTALSCVAWQIMEKQGPI